MITDLRIKTTAYENVQTTSNENKRRVEKQLKPRLFVE